MTIPSMNGKGGQSCFASVYNQEKRSPITGIAFENIENSRPLPGEPKSLSLRRPVIFGKVNSPIPSGRTSPTDSSSIDSPSSSMKSSGFGSQKWQSEQIDLTQGNTTTGSQNSSLSSPFSVHGLVQGFSKRERPTPLVISYEPMTPKEYAAHSQDIRATRVIINANGEECRISDEANVKKGAFSLVYELQDETPRLHPEVRNSEVVVKILHSKHEYKAKERLGHAAAQYRFLEGYFREEKNPPIVKIYNLEEAASCGYTLAEKVTPFHKAPWDESTSIDRLSFEQKKALEVVEKLMDASAELVRNGLSGIDLKWNNLGKKKDGTVALLDYDNIPFYLNVTDSYARRLSGNNSQINQHLGEKERSLMER